MNQSADIVIVGAGNVATHLYAALVQAGRTVTTVMRRHPLPFGVNVTNAAGQVVAAPRVVTTAEDLPDAEVYIYCVKDDALPALAHEVAAAHPDGLHVHTSGSTPMSVFAGTCRHYGVIYPMQTFSRTRAVSFRHLPCFVEGSDADTLNAITALAGQLTDDVTPLDSDRRQQLHLAAVFACNFVNHCYAIAADLLERGAGVSARRLLPLIDETAAKVHELAPRDAQTGPAVRADRRIIEAHRHLLADDALRLAVYDTLTRSIHDYATATTMGHAARPVREDAGASGKNGGVPDGFQQKKHLSAS